jgi:replicative DNA helicase
MVLDDDGVLFHLFQSEEYARKVLPYIKPEYFSSEAHKHIFTHFNDFFIAYDNIPSKISIKLQLDNAFGIKEPVVNQINETLESLSGDTEANIAWLVDQTEKYTQHKAIYNAVFEVISIIDKKSKKSKDVIPELLSQALAVSFDQHIGHDYFDDAESRHDFYNKILERVVFDMDVLNKITHGGLPRKTLNVFASATGVGKSLIMCHLSSFYLAQGYNVLYITLEMAEERIAERIDVNLLDISLDEMAQLPKETFITKINKQWKKTKGKLIIKEYPTAGANAEHFKSLLRELQIKKGFVPDVVCVDYLTICTSSRYKPGTDVGSYFIGKAIAEEIRGLCVSNNLVGISAVQFNRGGYNNSDSDITNISESAAIAMTADTLFGLISTPELRKENKIMIKQLKNRLGDLNYYSTFLIGVDYSKMRIYELEGTKEIKDDANVYKAISKKPVIELSPTEYTKETAPAKDPKKKFNNFKF